MAFARGSQRGIRYIAESTYGTTPGSPNMQILRTTQDSLALSKDTFQSLELRSDRMITDLRHGNYRVGGDLGFELSYGAQDDLLQAALMASAWTAMYTLPTVANVTVAAAGKTFSRAAGDWTAAGVAVGDYIVTTGFSNGGNNGTFKVTTVTALVITCSGATGLVNEGPTSAGNFTTTHKKIVPGTTLTSFSIEKAHLDIGQYQIFRGMAPSSMKLTVGVNAMVTGSFSMVGASQAIQASTWATGGTTAAPTNSPFDGFTGTILEGGSSIAIVTGIDLNLDNGLTPTYVLMNAAAQSLVDKRSNLTGTLTAYFQDAALINKWINETASSMAFTLTDLAGNQLKFTIPRVKYSGANPPVQNEGPIMLAMPFQAVYDSTSGTSFQIERIPF